MTSTTARLAAIPLNRAAHLMLELRARARSTRLEDNDAQDPLAAIIRWIESTPGSRQSLAAVSLMTDIVRGMTAPNSSLETLEELSEELAALIGVFSERYQTGYLHDPRLARFRLVKHHRLA